MATVCVGCGLDVEDGKIRLKSSETEVHEERSFVNQPGASLPATFDTALEPELCIPVTNQSDCRTMVLKASIEGNAKLAWDTNSQSVLIFPEFSIDGGTTWTEGSQVGIAGPAYPHTEGRFVSIMLQRQVATLEPGESRTICVRYRARTVAAVTASATDLDCVFQLDGVYID